MVTIDQNILLMILGIGMIVYDLIYYKADRHDFFIIGTFIVIGSLAGMLSLSLFIGLGIAAISTIVYYSFVKKRLNRLLTGK